MKDVRITETAPIEDEFTSFDGSPICIDQTTDIAYYFNGSVLPLHCIGGKRYVTTTAVLDFPNTASNDNSDLTVSLSGASINDIVMLGPPPALEAGLTFGGFVSSANTITVRIHNTSGGAINPASATWRVSALI